MQERFKERMLGLHQWGCLLYAEKRNQLANPEATYKEK